MKRLLLLLLICSGCSDYYLNVRREQIDRRSLASTFVGSPDPRQDEDYFGQMITMEWKIPVEVLEQKPVVVLDIIYGDFTEGRFEYPIVQNWGYTTYTLLNPEYEQKKGIITYRARMILDNGEVYLNWEQQFWVNLIEVDQSTYEEIELNE